MNNKFDWNRFCKVVTKDFRNLWPMFGTSMLILAVLPFAVWLFMVVITRDASMPPDFRLMMIEFVAYVAAIMAPSRLYRTWNLRNEGIYFAMLPASKLEKFCSALLFSLIICPLIVYLGSMALDVFLTALPFGPWRDWLWQGKMGFPFTFDLSTLSEWSAAEEDAEMFMNLGILWNVGCWIGYICTVLMFVFTATLFKKHKVLQTILWIYVIEFALSLILIPIFIALAASDSLQGLAEWMAEQDPKALFDSMMWFAIIFNVLLAALFGWISWRRLKKMAY